MANGFQPFMAMNRSIILAEVLGIINSSATSSAFQTTTVQRFGFGKILFFYHFNQEGYTKI